MEVYTLITGASTGLGRAFAMECGEERMNLILVSLPGEGLKELCLHIANKFNVKVIPYETDLTGDKSVENLTNWIQENYRVNFLINNAGIGGSRSIFDASIPSLETMLRLNVGVTSLLTCSLLPELQSHVQAFVLNVSSIIALSPVANKTVYPASKAFVYSFSRGLYQELRGSNVHVSVVLPGPLATNSSVNSRIKRQGWLGKMLLLHPEIVAKTTLHKTMKKQAVIIPGLANKLSWLLMIIFPTKVLLPYLSHRYSREMEQPLEWQPALIPKTKLR